MTDSLFIPADHPIMVSARALLASYGGDVPGWQRQEAHKLSDALAQASRIPMMVPGKEIVVGSVKERLALSNAAGALDMLLHQVGQMSGMFDDEDGAIARAVEDGEHASACIAAALSGDPLPPAPGSDDPDATFIEPKESAAAAGYEVWMAHRIVTPPDRPWIVSRPDGAQVGDYQATEADGWALATSDMWARAQDGAVS